MNFLVTADAERHEIALVMRAAIAERLDVMHERRRHKASVLFAHLAQRFSCQTPVTNLSPHTAVPLVLSVAASKTFVVPLHRFLMLLAVAALAARQIGTATVATWAFRFPRHRFPFIKKATDGISPSHIKINPVTSRGHRLPFSDILCPNRKIFQSFSV